MSKENGAIPDGTKSVTEQDYQTDAERWASEKYSRIFGQKITYRIVLTKYRERDGKREIVWDAPE